MPFEKKGIFLFPLCTRTQNILGQRTWIFGIPMITIVGLPFHGGAAIHGQKAPFSAMVWTVYRGFVRVATGPDSALS